MQAIPAHECLPIAAALFSMNVVVPLTSGIVPHAILKMRLDGTPHDENDSDAEAHNEEQCDCPEHALSSLALAIHAAASFHRAADTQRLDTTPLLAPARGVPRKNLIGVTIWARAHLPVKPGPRSSDPAVLASSPSVRTSQILRGWRCRCDRRSRLAAGHQCPSLPP
jgi:hypothetical protein